MSLRDLPAIVKAYDVRGLVPEQLDAETATALGSAFARVVGAGPGSAVVVGHDMRPSSPELSRAFAAGVTGQGADVHLIGLASTDELYFASGSLDLPGAMFTASHNPAQYNGVKMCRAGARPIGQESGLAEIRDLAVQGVPGTGGEAAAPRGSVHERDVLGDYAAHLRSLVDLGGIRPLKVVVDAGNGMAGHTVPTVLAGLPLEVVPLYFELDGTFPNHEANPLEPANLRDVQAKVVEVGADIGLAFDGDADRCFMIDETGAAVSSSTTTALVAVRELAREPGAAVIHNLIVSRAVPEIITEHGGTPVRSRVGHSFIKEDMASSGAVFGGEHSGHYYFRDFWRADTGLLTAMHVLAALGSQSRPLSQLAAQYHRYSQSGEVNSTVPDAAAATQRVREAFVGREGVTSDEVDGLSVDSFDSQGWWFNVRPSNTEPLLRLTVEGRDEPLMARVRDEVLGLIRSGEGSV